MAFAQAGYPDRPFRIVVAFPPGASTDIVARLNKEMNRILQLPDMKGKLDVQSLEFQPITPQQFAAALKVEVARYAKMVKESGAKVD